jgi:hypothetical protein
MHSQALQNSRIVYLAGRSLIGKVPGRMFRAMVGRLFIRQFAALVVALGVFLSGAAPAWAGAIASGDGAISSGVAMMMPGMDMQGNCMSSMDKSSPAKQAPCKNTDNSCSACAGCAVNIGLAPQFSAASLFYQRDTGLFTAAARPDGLAIAPDLPPPILRA